MSDDSCTLCNETEFNMSPLERGGACCLPCLPWVGHINNVYKPRPTIAALKRLGYPNISSIRKLARDIHSEESDMTRSLGFCPFFLPEKGPENDKHWQRLIQQISISQSLGWGTMLKKQVDLEEDTLEVMMDHIQSLGIKYLPKSNLQKERLANIIGGAFGDAAKDAIVARILQWNTPRDFFADEDALPQSFRWLKEIVGGLDSNRVWFNETGIMIIGTSGNVYEVVPSRRRPRYRVSLPESNIGVCLNSISSNEPFGDVLANLVLALYNDELSATRIPLLEAVLPKPSSIMANLSDAQCANCAREMIDGDYPTNPNLAPRSSVDPTLCKTCNAGNILPEGVEFPGDDES